MAQSNQNIRVCARFRPQFAHETDKGGEVCVKVVDGRAALITQGNKNQQFSFDRVFDPLCDQKVVYEETVGHMVDELLSGFNCTILAYGQTGSGKTFTMQGAPTAMGIMPRLMKALFEKISEFPGDKAPEDMRFDVCLSYVEIYKGLIRDLLEQNKAKRQSQRLKIKHDFSSEGNGGVYLDGACEKYVHNHEEVLGWIDVGASNRKITGTKMNPESSRSHGLVIVKIHVYNVKNGSQRTAKLMMVDLAGSEAAKKTGATGNTLKEAQAINGDLTALGAVMNQLTTRTNAKPAYRSSKLTHLLADSLGGNCKTTLIVCASESSFNVTETISTLRFAKSAKKVKNKAIVNEEKSVAEYKEEIERLKKKVTNQKCIITALKKDLSRALEGHISNINDCMFKRIEAQLKKGEKIEQEKEEQVEEKEEQTEEPELRRSPSNQSLESMASTDSKLSNSDHPSHQSNESGGSAKTLPSDHHRTLTNTSLGSIGENELIVSKDQYEAFCEALERLGEVRNDFSELKLENHNYREKLVDKQAELDAFESKMEYETKKWSEKKISLRYKNEQLQRKNAELRERFQATAQSFEIEMSNMEAQHEAKIRDVRLAEQKRVDKFITEARDAFLNDSRLNASPHIYQKTSEQRLKLLSAENTQLRQAFQERNQEYVDWKLKAFKMEQGVKNMQRKMQFQHNEIKLLGEAKKEAQDIHYYNIKRFERELKKKEKEITSLKKKVQFLESCMDEDAQWIGRTTQALRGQFQNMNMWLRPRRAQVEEQDIPIPRLHSRGPSNVFAEMYTPDPAHVYRQPSIDFSHLYGPPNPAYQTPQGPFQGYERYQNPQAQNQFAEFI